MLFSEQHTCVKSGKFDIFKCLNLESYRMDMNIKSRSASVHHADQFEYKVDYVWSANNKIGILVILLILWLGGLKGILCKVVSPIVIIVNFLF